jgi:type VI secretion system ImpM family protein
MLGKIIGRRPWSWTAFGKHPSIRDYFQFRLEQPLAIAFAKWIENGFARLDESTRRSAGCSWRFWSRGMKKGGLVCGLGKSSADGIGRPYPLILIGEGSLEGWEKHWHLLPFLLAPVWARLEYAAARRLDSIDQLEADLARMETPLPEWKKIVCQAPEDDGRDAFDPVKKIILSRIPEKSQMLNNENKLLVPLDAVEDGDPLQMAGAWHQGLKHCCNGPPNTVFMGGHPQKPHVVFYTRPLSVDDFVDLWSLEQGRMT